MKTWEVRVISGNDGTPLQTAYVEAASDAHAREWAARRKMVVGELRAVRQDQVPAGVHVDRFVLHTDDPLTLIAESPLIQSPVWTIALGVAIGVLLSSCVMAIFAIAMGGSFRG